MDAIVFRSIDMRGLCRCSRCKAVVERAQSGKHAAWHAQQDRQIEEAIRLATQPQPMLNAVDLADLGIMIDPPTGHKGGDDCDVCPGPCMFDAPPF